MSSNVRNVSPVVAARSKAMYRNVAAGCGSGWLQPLRMFDLPGVTPPAELPMNQLPGALSLLPPANSLSALCGSGELMTLPSPCQSRAVGRRCSLQKLCSATLGRS